ncbi:hypothetical protein OIU78_001269 [Salix suchowensis]|nr:hypothetical protein OIU78_001269 [Salix suchowensis]
MYLAKNTRCRDINRSGVSCKVATPQIYAINGEYKSNSKKKVDIVEPQTGLVLVLLTTSVTRDLMLLFLEMGMVLVILMMLVSMIRIPFARNVCSSFDDSSGWTFFNLNDLFDEHRNSPATILQADFYHANELLPLKDEHIAAKVMSYLSKCVKDFEAARVTNVEITRFPKSLTHFFPGSYKYMMRGSTSFPNLFMAGDWIITRHGSCSSSMLYYYYSLELNVYVFKVV